MINNPWVLCGAGTFFCISGVYFFFKNVFEDGRSLRKPLLLVVMGIILIGVGTAKYVKLI